MANKKLESLENTFFSSYKGKRRNKKRKHLILNSNFIVFLLAVTLVSLMVIALSKKQLSTAVKKQTISTNTASSSTSYRPYPEGAKFFIQGREVGSFPIDFQTQNAKKATLIIEFSTPFNLNTNNLKVTLSKIPPQNINIRAVFRDTLFFSNSNNPYLLKADKRNDEYILDIIPPSKEASINFYKINQIRINFYSPGNKGIWSIKKIEVIKKI